LQPLNRYYAWFEALHTRVDLLLYGSQSEEEFLLIENAVVACLKDIEKMGNRFDPDSELSQAVQKAKETNEAVRLSPALFALLDRCLRANRETEGLFDITVNTPAYEPGLISAVELTSDGCLRLHRADIVLDLSGILKGYALEQVRSLLLSQGVEDALVNLGNSSVLSLGKNLSDIPSGFCLTTSGNSSLERRHIRHPLTGAFVTGKRQVSVTTADGVEGEIQSIVTFIQAALTTQHTGQK